MMGGPDMYAYMTKEEANPEGLEDYVRRENEAYYRLAEKKLKGYALKREGTSRYSVHFIEDRPPVILKKE